MNFPCNMCRLDGMVNRHVEIFCKSYSQRGISLLHHVAGKHMIRLSANERGRCQSKIRPRQFISFLYSKIQIQFPYRSICSLLASMTTRSATQANMHIVNNIKELLNNSHFTIWLNANLLQLKIKEILLK